MTENELKRCREEFESWYDHYFTEHSICYKQRCWTAWQHQQATIDALMQNTESMSQTNSALLKKLDNYDDNYMAETRKVAHQSALLAKAVEALEQFTRLADNIDNHTKESLYQWVIVLGRDAKTALAEITKGDNDAK